MKMETLQGNHTELTIFDRTDLDIAWAAGILEGEGCFSRHQRKGKPYFSYAIHCEMTDKDVIESLQEVFGVGTVVSRQNMSGRADRRKRKPTWIWSVQNKEGIRKVLLLISHRMKSRRQDKIKLMLGELLEDI